MVRMDLFYPDELWSKLFTLVLRWFTLKIFVFTHWSHWFCCFPCRTCLEFSARVLKQSWRRLETAGSLLCGPIKDVGHIMRWLWLDDVRCTCLMMLLISPPRTSQVQRFLTHFRVSGRWTPWKRPCSKLLGVQMRMLLDHGGWMSDHHQLWYELRCLSISTISLAFQISFHHQIWSKFLVV